MFFDQTLINVLKQLEASGDIDEVVDILYYLLNEASFLEESRFWRTIHQELSQTTEGQFMTIAQKLEERGAQRGRQELLHIIPLVLDMLSHGEDIQTISKKTGLTAEEITLLTPPTTH